MYILNQQYNELVTVHTSDDLQLCDSSISLKDGGLILGSYPSREAAQIIFKDLLDGFSHEVEFMRMPSANRAVCILGVYKHFKGKYYRLLAVMYDRESNDYVVIYEALYDDHKIWKRPLAEFESKVDKDKYPESEQEFRFQLKCHQYS